MIQKMNEQAFQEALQAKKTFVVDFFADWCGPCRMLASVMEDLSDEMMGTIPFVKIDVDDCPDLAREYSIMSIPCVMVFKEGELKDRKVGSCTKDAMREFIQKNL